MKVSCQVQKSMTLMHPIPSSTIPQNYNDEHDAYAVALTSRNYLIAHAQTHAIEISGGLRLQHLHRRTSQPNPTIQPFNIRDHNPMQRSQC